MYRPCFYLFSSFHLSSLSFLLPSLSSVASSLLALGQSLHCCPFRKSELSHNTCTWCEWAFIIADHTASVTTAHGLSGVYVLVQCKLSGTRRSYARIIHIAWGFLCLRDKLLDTRCSNNGRRTFSIH